MNPMCRPGSSSALISDRAAGFLRCAALAITPLAIIGCANIEETVPPVATLAVRGKDTSQLEAGRSLYLQKCAGCHVAAPVRKHPASDWPRIMGIMSERADRKSVV